MTNHNTKKPTDGKNVEERDFLRYSFSSGQPSIHGMTNFRVKSQEGQSFTFHQSTGVGAEPKGPGGGRAVLSTPGLYEEDLGNGLLFRESPITYCLPAKQINCKRGDIVLNADNGDIILVEPGVYYEQINFLDKNILKGLQNNFLNLDYKAMVTEAGAHYGFRYNFPKSFYNDPIVTVIKNTFFPNRNLNPIQISANIRFNTTNPLFHVDTHASNETGERNNHANFLLYVIGETSLNNGTGFMTDKSLSSSVGFVENRAVFFNGNKILHSDLQSFGNSSSRYTLNIFYEEK